MNWLFGTTHDFPQSEYHRIWDLLTPSRRARIEALKQPCHQKRSLAGDLLAERLTGRQIEMSSSGQPLVPGGGLHISIAHCQDAVVCVAAEVPVGIDIEKIRPMDLAIIRHICTPEEAEYLFGHTPSGEELAYCEDPAILQRFFEIWTGKEAYFKQKGTGITDLKSISILPLARKVILRDGYLITIL